MASYWLTFRIHDDAGYPRRYKALMDAVESYEGGYWSTATSFIMFEADEEIEAVARKLVAGLDRQNDTLLIRYVSKDAARFLGSVEDFRVVQSFIPGAKEALMHVNRNPHDVGDREHDLQT